MVFSHEGRAGIAWPCMPHWAIVGVVLALCFHRNGQYLLVECARAQCTCISKCYTQGCAPIRLLLSTKSFFHKSHCSSLSMGTLLGDLTHCYMLPTPSVPKRVSF